MFPSPDRGFTRSHGLESRRTKNYREDDIFSRYTVWPLEDHMQVIIAFWRVVTLPCNWDDQPIGTKIAGYREKAIRVINRMEGERARLGVPGAKMIFVAPEHLFRCSTTRMAMPE